MRYEIWAFEQLRGKNRCRIEHSMACIPLRNDPICKACYESSENMVSGPDEKETLSQKEQNEPKD